MIFSVIMREIRCISHRESAWLSDLARVLKTRITQDEVMIAEMQTLIKDYRPCGQITVQLIQNEQTGDNYYIEINPRFGGGSPLSMKAGADSAEAVIRMLRGEILAYRDKAAKDGAIYCRFDQSVCVNEDVL